MLSLQWNNLEHLWIWCNDNDSCDFGEFLQTMVIGIVLVLTQIKGNCGHLKNELVLDDWQVHQIIRSNKVKTKVQVSNL